MEYMVKSGLAVSRADPDPGLLPGVESLTNGDIGRKQQMTATMLDGFYRSTFSPDPVSGRPFAADAVISNPPSFAHFHVVEALGIPLHMSFSKCLHCLAHAAMPWTASAAFPHPLMGSSRGSKSATNYLGFALADNL